MKELEKILEEIEAHAIEFEVFGTSDDYISVGWANDIIRRHMKNEENILKFYYCESEDDYYLGQRVQNMYYARYADGVFTWFMSRHLPWGEGNYPSEPKEIPFMKWIEGFISKHMNDGWISVEERLPEKNEYFVDTSSNKDFPNGYYRRLEIAYMTDTVEYVHGYYDGYKWMDKYLDTIKNIVAWKVHEPYRPERSNDEKK